MKLFYLILFYLTLSCSQAENEDRKVLVDSKKMKLVIQEW
jgi:hypothetical protein